MPTNTYLVIEENRTEPAITISLVEYAGKSYLEYQIRGWGGGASPIEKTEEFSKNLGSSIKYVKKHCERRGNLG